MDIETITAVLGDAYQIIEHDDFVEIQDADGVTLALIGGSPLVVQAELSAVLLDAADVASAASAADEALRTGPAPAWIESGFVLAEAGEARGGESDDGAEWWSYDLALTTQAAGADQLREIIDWIFAQPREFAWLSADGILVETEEG